jgi:hypothetical protein
MKEEGRESRLSENFILVLITVIICSWLVAVGQSGRFQCDTMLPAHDLCALLLRKERECSQSIPELQLRMKLSRVCPSPNYLHDIG